ncbi:MAG TPA: hypothetical protein VJB90_01260 [Candidatus Nanoarchaeia archaeon]|nr:hypothetical protein [Candidatus Nanoarchaeia archaeon]
MKIKPFVPILALLILIDRVRAHCPLCTIGVAAAAGGASLLGLNDGVIGIFVGAFAISTGWWASGLIKKKYIPYQRLLLITFSFIGTVVPLFILFKGFYPLYISFWGGYGSLFNRVYLVNLFLVGSSLGGLVVIGSPWISKKFSGMVGKTFPFQLIGITFAILLLLGAIIQVAV